MINPFEEAVVNKLLAGDDATLANLRVQLTAVSSATREMSGVGFFLSFILPNEIISLPKESKQQFCFGDVACELPHLNSGMGFLLWIVDGKLNMLEGYTYGESWTGDSRNFQLSYFGGKRELNELKQAWYES